MIKISVISLVFFLYATFLTPQHCDLHNEESLVQVALEVLLEEHSYIAVDTLSKSWRNDFVVLRSLVQVGFHWRKAFIAIDSQCNVYRLYGHDTNEFPELLSNLPINDYNLSTVWNLAQFYYYYMTSNSQYRNEIIDASNIEKYITDMPFVMTPAFDTLQSLWQDRFIVRFYSLIGTTDPKLYLHSFVLTDDMKVQYQSIEVPMPHNGFVLNWEDEKTSHSSRKYNERSRISDE